MPSFDFTHLLDQPHLRELLTIFYEAKVEARVVGGAVRDALLGYPIHDIDIAAATDPKTLVEILSPRANIIPTGLKHGTITLVFPKNAFQITSLRQDVVTFGRHAEVTYGTSFEEDAKRRDFTINAMYVDRYGTLYDFFYGQEDLRKGLIRFVGDPEKRVQEDYLRILRYFRMYAFFGHPPFHEESLQACCQHVFGITSLSRERIRAEMMKMLEADQAADVIQKMQDCHILDVIQKGGNLAHLYHYTVLEKTRHLAPSSLYRLYSLYSSVDARIIEKSFVLTKRERQTWDLLTRLRGREILVAELVYHYGLDFTRRFLLLYHVIENKTTRLFWSTLEGLQEGALFPLQAADLKPLGFKGKALGEALKKAEHYWCEKNYAATCEELLEYIKTTSFSKVRGTPEGA